MGIVRCVPKSSVWACWYLLTKKTVSSKARCGVLVYSRFEGQCRHSSREVGFINTFLHDFLPFQTRNISFRLTFLMLPFFVSISNPIRASIFSFKLLYALSNFFQLQFFRPRYFAVLYSARPDSGPWLFTTISKKLSTVMSLALQTLQKFFEANGCNVRSMLREFRFRRV